MKRLLTNFNNSFIKDKRTCSILISGNRIEKLNYEYNHLEKDNIDVEDLNGNYLIPGFVDIQVNGVIDQFYSNLPTEEKIETICHELLKKGVTSFYLTIITTDENDLINGIKIAQKYKDYKNLKGLHLEGPFISKNKKGIHPLNYIKKSDIKTLKKIFEADKNNLIKIITLAPEEVSDDFIKIILERGIKICAGHSNCNIDVANRSFKRGVSGVTHLFNAMSGISAREPGLAGAAIMNENIYQSIICDGFHVHTSNIKMAIRLKPDKTFIVSDMILSKINNIKKYNVAGKTIYCEDGRCFSEKGVLAGASQNIYQIFCKNLNSGIIKKEQLLSMCTEIPAKFLNMQTGIIKEDYNADFVILDKDLNIIDVILNGKSQ